MPETPLTHPLPIGTENVKLATKTIVVENEEIQETLTCMVEGVSQTAQFGTFYQLSASLYNGSNTAAATVQIFDVHESLIILS